MGIKPEDTLNLQSFRFREQYVGIMKGLQNIHKHLLVVWPTVWMLTLWRTIPVDIDITSCRLQILQLRLQYSVIVLEQDDSHKASQYLDLSVQSFNPWSLSNETIKTTLIGQLGEYRKLRVRNYVSRIRETSVMTFILPAKGSYGISHYQN